MLSVCVAGSTGRMGRTLIECIGQAEDIRLAAALEQRGNPHLGRDAGQALGTVSGVVISDDVASALAKSRVLIDFTCPEGTLVHLEFCRKQKVNAVIGTTGFTAQQTESITAASREIAILLSPNMSAGVNLVLKLVDVAARVLGDGYDVEIIEAHHRQKVDAPSGTALRIGEVIAEALGRALSDCAVYGRHGQTGERHPGTIGFATVRGGDIVGDHTALFAGRGERIEITHRASSRMTFAQGALRAARFIAQKDSGLFDMRDVLALR
jgi:4-hydroxy-tetrahydrodipicolinate reductase